MDYRRCAVFLLMGAAICNGAMAETGASTALELGYRVDNLGWNIAGNGNGQNPNILSELNWSDMVIYQRRFKLDAHSDNVHLLASMAYGQVGSGDNQDSDYDFDNRQGEFSRSNNRAGGDVADSSIGVGYRLAAEAGRGRAGYVMPMAGVSLHRQNLTMFNGNQTVSTAGRTPLPGPLSGLNSSYEAQWQGGWLGVRFMEEDANSGFKLAFDVVYHLIKYRAEADWNLRSDFLHPVSFAHRANGDGLTFSLNSSRRLTKNVDWLLGVDYGNWRTNYGIDDVYLTAGGIAQTRLNEVKWESLAINLGLALRF